jgi:hypothetical protein
VYELQEVEAPVVAIEFNMALRDDRYLRQAGIMESCARFQVGEPDAGVSAMLSLTQPATIMHFPIETVSESEEGLERTYQGLAIVCLWPVGGARAWTTRLQWDIEMR